MSWITQAPSISSTALKQLRSVSTQQIQKGCERLNSWNCPGWRVSDGWQPALRPKHWNAVTLVLRMKEWSEQKRGGVVSAEHSTHSNPHCESMTDTEKHEIKLTTLWLCCSLVLSWRSLADTQTHTWCACTYTVHTYVEHNPFPLFSPNFPLNADSLTHRRSNAVKAKRVCEGDLFW